MSFDTRITRLRGIEYPVLQGGMRWASRAGLAIAVGRAGGMGFISAHAQPSAAKLAEEIDRVRAATDRPFGVNLTLLAANTGVDCDGYAATIIDRRVPAVETAGSNPARFFEQFKRAGIKVLHKCTNVRHALKAEQLGADGINMGTRFLMTEESPLHPKLKAHFLAASERDTVLIGRSLRDTARVMKNAVSAEIVERERNEVLEHGDLAPQINAARWMHAMENGDIDGGAIPLGLVVGLIDDPPSCAEPMARIVAQATALVRQRLPSLVGAQP